MTQADDRALTLLREATDLRDFYRSQGKRESVRLFSEDFKFLEKRGDVVKVGTRFWFNGHIEVECGPRKRPARKRRPKEVLI